MKVDVTKVGEKGELLMLDNPNYQVLINFHSHLGGVEMEDKDSRPYLPIHLILGTKQEE